MSAESTYLYEQWEKENYIKSEFLRLHELYHDDDSFKFDKLRDLKAFERIHKIFPESDYVITFTTSDMIGLHIPNYDNITDEDIEYLYRCGVFFENDSMVMFV